MSPAGRRPLWDDVQLYPRTCVHHRSAFWTRVSSSSRFRPANRCPPSSTCTASPDFLDLEGAPRVYDSDSVGVGIITPKGVFRNSYAQIGWGVSKQFETDRKFDRMKINGVLVFDVDDRKH